MKARPLHSVDESERPVLTFTALQLGGAVAQLGARLDGIEEVVGSNPIGSTKNLQTIFSCPSLSLCPLRTLW